MHSHFDPDLVRAYDVNGPRYTSYPTANLFHERFSARRYEAALRDLDDGAPLSVYVHVPFCATICYYCACNKIVTNNRRHAVDYLRHLFAEMALVSRRLAGRHPVEQLHFGGGTPTYLTDDQFTAVFAELHRHFDLVDGENRDFSVEIDPRTVDPERIAHLCALGINRMSLGIQDFDPEVQLAVNRLQSEQDTARIVDAARTHGVRSVSVDLIYGLPRQNQTRFARTLTRVLGLGPDRISLYSYAHLPERFKTQRQIDARELPDPEAKLELLRLAVETLTGAGYVHVGMDHFARPADELVRAQHDGTLHRNFQGYTTHGHCELIGLGVSAISSVGSVYCQNAKTLDQYAAALDAGSLPLERGIELDSDDEMVREIIGTLMCRFELDLETMRARFGDAFDVALEPATARLKQMAQDDLVTLSPEAIRVTERGRYLIRNVCMAFDRYLPASTVRFSRAI